VPPLNSGPYEITAFKQGRYVEYRRDPDYWGKDIPINRGRYNFDTIRFAHRHAGKVAPVLGHAVYRRGVDSLDADRRCGGSISNLTWSLIHCKVDDVNRH